MQPNLKEGWLMRRLKSASTYVKLKNMASGAVNQLDDDTLDKSDEVIFKTASSNLIRMIEDESGRN